MNFQTAVPNPTNFMVKISKISQVILVPIIGLMLLVDLFMLYLILVSDGDGGLTFVLLIFLGILGLLPLSLSYYNKLVHPRLDKIVGVTLLSNTIITLLSSLLLYPEFVSHFLLSLLMLSIYADHYTNPNREDSNLTAKLFFFAPTILVALVLVIGDPFSK